MALGHSEGALPLGPLRGQLVLQLQTCCARSLLARLLTRTLPTNSAAVCLTATNRQFSTRFARVLLARLSARTLPTNSSAVCLTATSFKES